MALGASHSRALLSSYSGGGGSLSDGAVDASLACTIVGASLSVIGSGTILTCFALLPALRRFSFRLVAYLSVADLISSTMLLIGDPREGSFACGLQSYLSQFATIASVLWTAAIAFVLYKAVVLKTLSAAVIQPLERKLHFGVWGTSFILMLLPIIDNSYGKAGTWCWYGSTKTPHRNDRSLIHSSAIRGTQYSHSHTHTHYSIHRPRMKTDSGHTEFYLHLTRRRSDTSDEKAVVYVDTCMCIHAYLHVCLFLRNVCVSRIKNNDAGKALRLVVFYIPLWATISFNGVMYYYVGRTLRRTKQLLVGVKADDSSLKAIQIVQRLGWYPVILIGVWLFPTINRIQNWAAPEKPIAALYILTAITSSSAGVANAIAYGMNQTVRRSVVSALPLAMKRYLVRTASGNAGMGGKGQTSEEDDVTDPKDDDGDSVVDIDSEGEVEMIGRDAERSYTS